MGFRFWGLWLIYMIIVWVVNVIVCAWLAGLKNRNQIAWGVLAVFFPLFAPIWLAGAPKVEKQP